MKSYKLKVCLVGNEAVGKTSLIRRYVLNQFREEDLRTMGALVSKKEVTLNLEGKSVQVDMMVWDIMGRKQFVELVGDAYFEFANGVIAVCDATRSDTLGALDQWIAEVRAAAGEVPLVILANKSDLPEVRVSKEQLDAVARRYKATAFFTSAKTGENVEESFQKLAREMLTVGRLA